jgi:hypothetical protein
MQDTPVLANKQRKWASQKQRIFLALYNKAQTRLQVSVAENVPIQSVCYIVRSLRLEGKIRVAFKGKCPISGLQAEFITTAPPAEPGQTIPLFQ